tara:strand:- start:327 stop:1868 length:1542 start_codon:yes stop_codon:yes gene_type:complete
MTKIKKVLISVSDKKGLGLLLRKLTKYKIEIISSGGTFKEIKKLGFKCTELSKYTGSSEILDGRVKTLHPKIHAGILSKRNNRKHIKELKLNNFSEIDLVIVNFYPFENIVQKSNNHKTIIENIDIGGPAMVRAAAKNYNDVTVITGAKFYDKLINELEINNGRTSLEFRKEMSEIAFTETAFYDSVISSYFNFNSKKKFKEKKVIHGKLIKELRYGENPHQKASLYSKHSDICLDQLNGKELSYNNYGDIFAALSISRSLPKNIGTVIVKHSNPCGVSINNNPKKSYILALASDPISAFGGVVSFNFKIDTAIALELSKNFYEVVIGIGIEKNALKILKRKKNLRVIDCSRMTKDNLENIIYNFDNFLVQNNDNIKFTSKNFKVVSKKKPSSKMMKNLVSTFNICRFVKSNGIVISKGDSTVGIGSGQPSRLDSCKIAIDKMQKFYKKNNNEDIIAASDAFFPFVDGIETLVQAGIKAIIQPYGSIRDKEIIKFADQMDVILVFSKTRHFRH